MEQGASHVHIKDIQEFKNKEHTQTPTALILDFVGDGYIVSHAPTQRIDFFGSLVF